MRTLICVLLVLAGCKQAPKEPEAPLVNTALAAKLDAFGKDESSQNLEAVLNTLRTANLFIGVKPNANGTGGQAALHVDPKQGQVLYAFLEAPAARTWWSSVDGVVIQQTAAPRVLEVAQFEQADRIVLEPQLPDRSLVVPRDNYAPIIKAWASVGAVDSGTLH